MTYALLIYRSTPASEPIPELEERAALAAHRALQAQAATRGECALSPGSMTPRRHAP